MINTASVTLEQQPQWPRRYSDVHEMHADPAHLAQCQADDDHCGPPTRRRRPARSRRRTMRMSVRCEHEVVREEFTAFDRLSWLNSRGALRSTPAATRCTASATNSELVSSRTVFTVPSVTLRLAWSRAKASGFLPREHINVAKNMANTVMSPRTKTQIPTSPGIRRRGGAT